MTERNRDSLMAALARVVDPTFERPMVQLGTIVDARSEGDGVVVDVRLAAPGDATRTAIRSRIEEALAATGITKVDVHWNLQVPSRETMGDDPLPEVRNLILVMSGKGGVGKSTCAVNIATALQLMGARVGLLDADIYGPSIPTMMGIHEAPRATDTQKIGPLERFGVKLMSIGFLLEDPKTAIVWRGPMLHSALGQFLADVEWGALDYLVIDLPPGTGDVALTISQRLKSTVAVLITTPQEVALQDVYKGVSMCEKLSIPILGVIENMSYFIDTAGVRHELFGSGGGQKVADHAKAPLLGQIPIETDVRQWGDEGTPIVRAAPGASAAKELITVAERIAERIAQEHFKRAGGERVPEGKARTRLRILR